MREPETLAAQLVELAPDGLIFADSGGVIREWNAAATRIFGHTRAEAVGQSLDLIVPERFREAHWKGYDAALAAARAKSAGQPLTTRSARKDGTAIYVELSFVIVTDAGGAAIGALAQARDITERFAREREERTRVRALEEQVAALGGATPPPAAGG
ncbi:MAG: PAS domain S-box protein [Dehalococcoidia bacterium]|nr:PAS domain S-box protein [Dehalococcoidia bacterium]